MSASPSQAQVQCYRPDDPEVLALPIGEHDAIHVTRPGAGLRMIHPGEPHQDMDLKPRGLWYTLGREWMEWTSAEHWMDEIGHVYRLSLQHEKMIVLSSTKDLDKFTARYEYTTVSGLRYVDWRAVRRAYTGIEIAPYQWSRRMSLNWYYTLDVASECIWTPAAIVGVEQLL